MNHLNQIGGVPEREVDIDRRLARLETRIVQLMLHLGLNPYEKQYATDKQTTRRVSQ
jgi:hypothetical protein